MNHLRLIRLFKYRLKNFIAAIRKAAFFYSTVDATSAFRENYAASLAFKEELQLAPSYTPPNFYNNTYFLADALIYEAGTAYQGTLINEKNTIQNVEGAHQQMQPCKFKFVYSPSGTIDYEFHLKEEVNTKFITPNIISFSRPRSSWLYVLLNMPTEADEESEINQDDDCKTMRADNDLTGNFESTSTLSDVTTITRPQSSEAPEKILYIPPHKRSNFDTAHLRTSSEPSALLPKNASSAKDKGRYKSLNLTPKQRNPAMAKQTFTGAAYTPCPSPQLPGPLRVNAEGFAKFKEKITQNPQSDKPFKPFKPSNYSTYRGISKGIKGIKNLADHLNCSVFISHLPEKVYYHEIFSIINTGSVISAYIDDPIYGCPFSTAKITFKYPEGAARFIEQANSAEGIKIREHYLSVLYNAHGMVKYPIEHQSRVLYIEGPIHKMSGMFWKSYFIKITRFNLEYVGYLPLAQPHQFRRMMEFRFVRIGAQAERFFTAIIEDPQFYCPKYGRDVTVKYGEDPCGRGWDVLPRTKTI